jgi:hypothetical protein
LDLVQFVRDLGGHVARPAPLLLDINVHYRLLKLCYGQSMVQWDYRHHLRHHPPLFGCWHAYKHVLTVMYRQFHTVLLYLRHGSILPGTSFSWAVPVRSMEYWVGAVLQMPGPDRLALNRRVQEVERALQHQQSRVAALHNAMPRRVLDVVQAHYDALMAGQRVLGTTGQHTNQGRTRARALFLKNSESICGLGSALFQTMFTSAGSSTS